MRRLDAPASLAPSLDASDGLTLLRSLDAQAIMPMARHWNLRVSRIERGSVRADARADASHNNALGIAHGGFAATVLGVALELVGISVLDDVRATSLATVDLVVRYFVPITSSAGLLTVRASIVNQHGRQILAEAFLENARGVRYAHAQSNAVIQHRGVGDVDRND